MLREEDRAVASPRTQGLDQQGGGAGSGNGQLVNDPKHAVDAKPLLGSDSAEQDVACQQDPTVSKCGSETETVVCGQGSVFLLECEGLCNFGGCQVVSDQSLGVEVLPLLIREVEDFRSPYGQRNAQSVREVAKNGY